MNKNLILLFFCKLIQTTQIKQLSQIPDKTKLQLLNVSCGFVLFPNVILDTFRVLLCDDQGPKSKIILREIRRHSFARSNSENSLVNHNTTNKTNEIEKSALELIMKSGYQIVNKTKVRRRLDSTGSPELKITEETADDGSNKRRTFSLGSSVEIISESDRVRSISEGSSNVISEGNNNNVLNGNNNVLSGNNKPISEETNNQNKVNNMNNKNKEELITSATSSLGTKYYSASSNFGKETKNNNTYNKNRISSKSSINSSYDVISNPSSKSSYEVISNHSTKDSYDIVSNPNSSINPNSSTDPKFSTDPNSSTDPLQNQIPVKNQSPIENQNQSLVQTNIEKLNKINNDDKNNDDDKSNNLSHLPITKFITYDYIASSPQKFLNDDFPLINQQNTRIGTGIIQKSEAIKALNSNAGFFSSCVWNFRDILYTPTVESSVSPYYDVFLYQSTTSYESLYVHIVKKADTPRNFTVLLNLVPIIGNICTSIPQMFLVSTNTKMPVGVVRDEAGLIQIEYVDDGTENEVIFYISRLGIANSAEYIRLNQNTVDVYLSSDIFFGSKVVFTVTTQDEVIPNNFSIPDSNRDISLRKILNLLNTYRKTPIVDERSLKMMETTSMIETICEAFYTNWKKHDGFTGDRKLKFDGKIERGMRLNNMDYFE